MAKKQTKRQSSKKHIETTDKFLPRLTMALFGRPKLVFFAWIIILVLGITSYTTLLRREGFPSVNIPIAVVNGAYIVNDAAKVDADIAKPVSDIALKQEGVNTVLTQSAGNFVNITVAYKEGVDGQSATEKLKQAVNDANVLPESANLSYNVPYFGATGGSIEKIDATVSFYQNPSSSDTAALTTAAKSAVEYLNANKPNLVQEFFVIDPFKTAVNPATGQQQVIQETFDQFGVREEGENKFYNSVVIGVTAIDDVDVIKLDAQLEGVLGQLNQQDAFSNYDTDISASFAPAIEDSISELQRVLLEGLLAVLVVGSIIIAVRASLITVLSMITVITATLALLYFVGYTLNVITLFALILGLSLIVDDTIIMVEAIDAARRKSKTPREAVRTAVRKISRAMVAATSTAALSFLPLAFVSGVLGSFIRAIPITIISALIISLFVALIFIPLFAKSLLLGKKQMGESGVTEVAAGIEAKIARGLTWPMQWARRSTKRLWFVGMSAVMIGVLFIAGAGMIFNKVTFNLFPPSKDTNQLSVIITLPPGSTIETAEETAFEADTIIGKVVGDEFRKASYYGLATAQTATLFVDLTPYTDRGPTSKQLVDEVQAELNNSNFKNDATFSVAQVDIGPPASAFTVQVKTENREAGYRLANDIADYLRDAELTRASGTKATFTNTAVSTESTYTRADSQQVIQVSAGFDADDTTTLVTLAQDAIQKEFPESKLASYGVAPNALDFNIGQEEENQESFRGLVTAFPIVLIVIFILLSIEFRSLLQPLLIFMAIPFSLFGVTLGLYLTDNAFSFFCAMGFFALIGLSIKNTILVIDYANQSRRAGMGPIDAATAALEERFRPLIATSLTAVFSLIPLALISPFWQGLAVVLIGGLLSSTFLVVTVFPYYYLGGEYLRARVSRKAALLWLASVIILGVMIARIADGGTAFGVALLFAVLWPIVHHFLYRKVAKH
jgi:multidrug efflux pump subunit AcrB